jgi:hypothetical protein
LFEGFEEDKLEAEPWQSAWQLAHLWVKMLKSKLDLQQGS